MRPVNLGQALVGTAFASGVRLLDSMQRWAIGPLQDPATIAVLIGAGQEPLQAMWGATVGGCHWIGTKVLAGIKGHLPAAVGFELVTAKVIDYQLSTRLRRRGAMTPFYVSMARAGLEAGWSSEGRSLPWWYAPLSYGASGGTDFLLGQILGSQLRVAFDTLIFRGGHVPPQRYEALAEEFRVRTLELLVDSLVLPPGHHFTSPLLRHLAGALRGEHDPQVVRAVQRRLLTKHPGSPWVGTMIGHGIAGASVGLLTGDPILGLSVGLVDASGDAVLTQAAISGRIQTLGKVKAQLLHQGWSARESQDNLHNLSDYYAQIGAEFRALGVDLRTMASEGAALAETIAARSSGIEEWLLTELGQPAPVGEGSRLMAWLGNLSQALVAKTDGFLEAHAQTPWAEALGEDFPELRRAGKQALRQLRATVLATALERKAAPPCPPELAGHQPPVVRQEVRLRRRHTSD